MDSPEPLTDQIRAIYAGLSAVERRLADVIVARGKDLPAYSATELAQQAGVSKASAARFFRRLGYADFGAFRRHARESVSGQSPLHQLEQADAAAAPGLAAHLHADGLRLAALAERLPADALARALELLAEARHVWVAGYRNGFMIASYAQALLGQVRAGVFLPQDAAGQAAERLADLGPRDVLVAVDFRRRSRQLGAVVALAAEAGTPVVLVTDAAVSAVAARAAAVLACPAGEGSVFDSYVAPVSLVNYLATALAERQRRSAHARLARIEQWHRVLGDLDAER